MAQPHMGYCLVVRLFLKWKANLKNSFYATVTFAEKSQGLHIAQIYLRPVVNYVG